MKMDTGIFYINGIPRAFTPPPCCQKEQNKGGKSAKTLGFGPKRSKTRGGKSARNTIDQEILYIDDIKQ